MMHERLEALKPLLKAGEYEKAAEALKEYRTEFPYDWDGKLMEGIIAQLQGDEETFRRIHDEAQAVIDGHGKEARQIKASSLWKKYSSTLEKTVDAFVICLFCLAIGGVLVSVTYGTYIVINNGMVVIAKIFQEMNANNNTRYIEREQINLQREKTDANQASEAIKQATK